ELQSARQSDSTGHRKSPSAGECCRRCGTSTRTGRDGGPFATTAQGTAAVLIPFPLPATASAEGAQLNGRPFPATASAEGRQFNVPPSLWERVRVRGFIPGPTISLTPHPLPWGEGAWNTCCLSGSSRIHCVHYRTR